METRDAMKPHTTPSYSHNYKYDLTKRVIEKTSEFFGTTPKTLEYTTDKTMKKLFGTITIESDTYLPLDYMVGFRTSYDKSLANQFCGGGSVIVCSNMLFCGDIFTSRKHTTHMHTDLDDKIAKMLTDVQPQFDQLLQTIEDLKAAPLNNSGVSSILGELLYNRGIIGSHTANRAWTIWDKGSAYDGEGVYDNKDAWRLYNCLTEVTRTASPVSAFQIHRDLHNYFKTTYSKN